MEKATHRGRGRKTSPTTPHSRSTQRTPASTRTPEMPDQATLLHRDPLGLLTAVRPFTRLEWTHRFAQAGSFRLELPLENGRDLACGDNIDIELDGRLDFSGIVQFRTLLYRPQAEPAWRIEGLDLSWWLRQRVILPPAGASHDEQLGVPAETAIRHYITDHLLAPTDPARAIPVPALLAPANAPPLGPGVTVRARYSNLLREIEEIATLAGIGFAAARLAGGAIAFRLRAPRDRTAAAPAPVVFSPQLGTVQTLAYTEAALRSRNAVYVLGSGAGATRLVRLVTDDADIAARGRREFSFDARDADTAAAAAARRRRRTRPRSRPAPAPPGPGPRPRPHRLPRRLAARRSRHPGSSRPRPPPRPPRRRDPPPRRCRRAHRRRRRLRRPQPRRRPNPAPPRPAHHPRPLPMTRKIRDPLPPLPPGERGSQGERGKHP